MLVVVVMVVGLEVRGERGWGVVRPWWLRAFPEILGGVLLVVLEPDCAEAAFESEEER